MTSYIYDALFYLFLVLGVAVVGLAAVLFCLGVGVDTLLTLGSKPPTLTCFHCGNETQADRKHCQHCGRELQ